MIDDAAREHRLAVLPACEHGGIAGGDAAADGLEALGCDGGAVDAVAERAVVAVPIAEDEVFAAGRFVFRGP